MNRYRPVSVKKIRRYSLRDRKSMVEATGVAVPLKSGATFSDFISSLPNMLAARDFKEIAGAVVDARRRGRPVVLGMGSHPIKVGLSPLIIDLMREGIVTAISTNGASAVHDFEIAYAGKTSEDVASGLKDGSFGMARETAVMINRAIKRGAQKGMGAGEAIGEFIFKGKGLPFKGMSIFSEAYRLSVPLTVHIAIGTDIIHMHPECSGEATGKASLIDFRIFTGVVSELAGGVFINLGSAVIIPEVFLKALTLSRNLGHKVESITTVTMDFNRNYRPMVNVAQRPVQSVGKGYYITGHHEIMFPLLAQAVREWLS